MLRRWTAEAATGKCVLRFFLSLPWTNQSTAAAGAHSNWKLSMVRRNSKRKKILMWRVIVINTTKQLHSSQNCEKKMKWESGFCTYLRSRRRFCIVLVLVFIVLYIDIIIDFCLFRLLASCFFFFVFLIVSLFAVSRALCHWLWHNFDSLIFTWIDYFFPRTFFFCFVQFYTFCAESCNLSSSNCVSLWEGEQ